MPEEMPEKKKITGRIRAPGPQSEDERQRLRDIREEVMKEFPPRDPAKLQPAAGGIGAKIQSARKSRGLTWYTLAEKAGVEDASIVRDIECGREVTLANFEAVVSALGLRLELIEQVG
jgi:ribosome-binding protein aMBF1 (putative translation factor)